MHTARRIVRVVGDAVMGFVAIAILISMVVSTADVIGLRLFSEPVGGAFEGAANLMPVIVFVSLAYIQRHRQHVRVEFFYVKGSPRTRALLDIFNAVVIIIFFALLAWAAWRAFEISWAMNEREPGSVRFPIYPIKGVVVIGAVMMVAQGLVDLVGHVKDAIDPPPEEGPPGPEQTRLGTEPGA